jgi:Undecaprenyl-phosphate glucose phosphotransferase
MLATDNPRPADTIADLPRPPSASLVRWTHGLVNRIVMLTDTLLLTAATFVFWIASSSEQRPLTWLQASAINVITLIGFHIVMRWRRCYRVERYTEMRQSLTDVCTTIVLAGIPAMIIVVAFLPSITTSQDWLLGWTGASFVGLITGRYLARLLVYIIQRCALLRTRVIVVGAGSVSDDIVGRLRNPNFARDYQLLGVIDPFTTSFRQDHDAGPDSARSFSDLTQYAQNYAVDLVIIAMASDRLAEIFALTRRLQWIAADVVAPFETAGLHPQFVPQMSFTDGPLLQLMHRPLKGTQGLFKLAEDYVVGVIALIVACPIMLIAAAAIRLEGTGPILFRQPRVGFNSKPFVIYKFRTMTVDPTDDASRGTQRNSQRITRVGRILRRTSIDELPQLINVLRGEMSIVGPRPHVPNMLVGEGVYSEVVQQYAARHRIKPGITGWAQINGMRGGIDSVEKASRGAALDLHYIANWSPKFDFKIMVRTIVTGLVGRNVF